MNTATMPLSSRAKLLMSIQAMSALSGSLLASAKGRWPQITSGDPNDLRNLKSP